MGQMNVSLFELIASTILIIISIWLMFFLLHAKLERKREKWQKLTTTLAVAVILIAFIITNSLGILPEGTPFFDFAVVVLFGIILFLYSLIFLKGTPTQKLFWVGIALAFYLLGTMIGVAYFFVAFPETPYFAVAPAWALMQNGIIIAISQGFATLILVRKKTTASSKMAPPALLLLTATPALSCIALIQLAHFGNTNMGDSQAIASLELVITLCLGAINFAVFALYNYLAKMSAMMLSQQKELQKAELEKVYHSEINALYQETRAWRHDFRNHVHTIKGFYLQKKYEALGMYLDAIDQSVDKLELQINSGNELLDALVNTKISSAKERGIEFTFDVQMKGNTTIDTIDLTTLVGNLLDNSIEACERAAAAGKEPFIEFSLSDTRKNQLMISLENSMEGQPIITGGRYISSKTEGDHGIGMQQIDAVVNKYNGFVLREPKEGAFSTFIRIPLKQDGQDKATG